MAKIHVNTTINGAPTEYLCDANQTLLDVLRDDLGLTGTKEGCGYGRLRRLQRHARRPAGLLLPGARRRGAGRARSRPSRAWPRATSCIRCSRSSSSIAALQCGICTPGFLIAAKALLDEDPDPTEDEIRYWLAGNLCRCTGYDKIVRAVLDAAAEMRGVSTMSRAAAQHRPASTSGRHASRSVPTASTR